MKEVEVSGGYRPGRLVQITIFFNIPYEPSLFTYH
jgi:hypothetical protein